MDNAMLRLSSLGQLFLANLVLKVAATDSCLMAYGMGWWSLKSCFAPPATGNSLLP